MKSPHLLSSAHDLACCTRSAQASHSEKVVSSLQLRLSSHDTRPAVTQTGWTALPSRRFLQTSCPQATPFTTGFQAVRIWNTFSRCSSSFFIGRLHAAFLSVSFCRLQSSGMGFANSPPDNTARIEMTIPTQIQNQPLVSHMFLTSQIDKRQSFAASATAGRVVATNHELQPIGGRRAVPFKSEVIRLKSTIFVPRSASLCFPGLARTFTTPSAHNCCSHASK